MYPVRDYADVCLFGFFVFTLLKFISS